MTPWTSTSQVPLVMGFPRQEYWSGLPFHIPGNRILDLGFLDLPDPRIAPESLASPALSDFIRIVLSGFFLSLLHLGSPKALETWFER